MPNILQYFALDIDIYKLKTASKKTDQRCLKDGILIEHETNVV